MSSKLPLGPKKAPLSSKIFYYFDLLEKWHAATKMMPTVMELSEAADRSHSTTDIALNKLQDYGYIIRVRLAHRAIQITPTGATALKLWRDGQSAKNRIDGSNDSRRRK